MTFHRVMFLRVFFLTFSLALLWHLGWLPLQPSHCKAGAARPTVHRLLKPRTPNDCPACRLASTPSSGGGPAAAPVRPWREVKSRRGAPKRVNTEGFACANPQCAYCGITDASIHALMGDGKHGQAEQIQTFRCQACRSTFTARRNTPLYRLKTPSQQIAMVLSALAEGLDPSAAERVFGSRQATSTTWLTWNGGEHTTILCVLTTACAWRSCSHESELADAWRHATDHVLLRWLREEPLVDGRRARCSLVPCQRFPLESHQSRRSMQCHIVGRWVKVPATEVRWGLTPG